MLLGMLILLQPFIPGSKYLLSPKKLNFKHCHHVILVNNICKGFNSKLHYTCTALFLHTVAMKVLP